MTDKKWTTFNNEKVLWSKGKYAIVEVDNARVPGNKMMVVVNEMLTDYPIMYSDGTIAYDHPEWFPRYVKGMVSRLAKKKKMNA